MLPPVVSDLPNVPLSVLDLAPIPEGATAGDALRATIDLARRAEQLGYHRFWVAEHHNMPGIASSAPAVLIGHLAAATSTHPRRVRRRDAAQPRLAGRGRAVRDAGGAAPGPDRPGHRPRPRHGPGDGRGAAALARGALGRRLPRATRRADRLLRREHGRRATRTRPSPRSPAWATSRPCGFWGRAGTAPRWPASSGCRLRSPTTSARRTRCRRWPCTASGSARRRRSTGRTPWSAAAVICADTDERAQWLAGPGALSFLRLRSGRPGRAPVARRRRPPTPTPRSTGASIRSRQASNIIGSAETVRRGLTELLAATNADELMITTMVHDPADRLHSLELVANMASQARAQDAAGLTSSTADLRRGLIPAQRVRALRPGERPMCARTHRGARSAAGGSGGRCRPKWHTPTSSRRLVIEWTAEL